MALGLGLGFSHIFHEQWRQKANKKFLKCCPLGKTSTCLKRLNQPLFSCEVASTIAVLKDLPLTNVQDASGKGSWRSLLEKNCHRGWAFATMKVKICCSTVPRFVRLQACAELRSRTACQCQQSLQAINNQSIAAHFFLSIIPVCSPMRMNHSWILCSSIQKKWSILKGGRRKGSAIY